MLSSLMRRKWPRTVSNTCATSVQSQIFEFTKDMIQGSEADGKSEARQRLRQWFQL